MVKIEIRKPAVTVTAIILGLFVAWYVLAQPSTGSGKMGSKPSPTFQYEYVKGFFKQGEPDTDAKTFNYTKNNFGLIDRKYDIDDPLNKDLTHWQRFEKHVQQLVNSSPEGTVYKVIYLGRHGEGYHNLGEAKYGTKAWDDYWSKLDGDDELYWSDAHLTQKGKHQALDNNAFLRRQFMEAKMPYPGRYFSSPLYRCLQTAKATYSGLEQPEDKAFVPEIKELMREVMGEHTCDRRSNRTFIHDEFPSWRIEDGFSEEDELWQKDHRETYAEHDARTLELLDDVFANEEGVWWSFTSHSGAIASLLRVIGHREYRLPTGGMMPIFVKATRKD